MPTSKVLQTPEIIEIIGSTIRVKHPDVSGNTKTSVQSPILSAGTYLTVADNRGFADNDWFIIGELNDPKTEECDVNGSVTLGTAITITNTNKFAHEIHAPVIKIFERGIKIYGASSDGGAGTLIASIDAITAGTNQLADSVMIQWDKGYTEYTLISTDTTYDYYYAVFTDGTTDSSSSAYVLASGLTYNTVEEVSKIALDFVNARLDGNLLNRDKMLSLVNDWQDEIVNFVNSSGVPKDWSFELFKDNTSLAATQNENSYSLGSLSSTLKYTNTQRGLLNVRFGDSVLKYLTTQIFDQKMEGKTRTNVATQAVAGDTSIVLDDSSEFSTSGTIYVGSDTVTYTANNTTTNTLSGIPASGSGAITATHAVDAAVWQGISPGLPEFYTIWNNKIIVDVPIKSTYVPYKFKIKGLKKLSRYTSMSEVVTIPFTYTAKYYIGSQIENMKRNETRSERLAQEFKIKLEQEAQRDPVQYLEQVEYYNFNSQTNNPLYVEDRYLSY